MIEDLKEFSLVYLATPYSKYKDGIEEAFKESARVAARLMVNGVKVYSPIAHTHPLAIYGKVDLYDHSIWLPFDATMMEKADALAVARMDGWTESYGIAHEIDVFRIAGKPIFYLELSEVA